VIERSRFEGRVLSWQDVPHEGPLLPGTRRDFLHARAAFLAEEGWQDAATIRRALEGRDRKLLEALREGREVVLWFEHDLLDQLQLIEILSLAGEPDVNLTGLNSGTPTRSRASRSFTAWGSSNRTSSSRSGPCVDR